MNIEKKITRFDKYMEVKGLNDNKVTRQLSLSVGLLGKSREEGRDLSDKVIEKILNYYTDLDSVWLLTGTGEMLKNVKTGTAESLINYIRLLPISAIGGLLTNFTTAVMDYECEKIISPIKDADFAITVTGESMQPEFPAGSQILIKKIDEAQFIEWGRTFVLDTCNGVVIKKIIKGDPGYYRCVSSHPDQEKYSPFDIPVAAVFAIYRVMMIMSMK